MRFKRTEIKKKKKVRIYPMAAAQAGNSRPRTFVIANQKGGVGKTVTSMGLAQILSMRGRVLAIDLDPQGHLTLSLGGDKHTDDDLYAALTVKNYPVTKAVQVISDNLHVLPGTINLTRIEKETELGVNFWLLKRVIEPLRELVHYDYIVIDTPPALGIICSLALTACKNGGIIIPAFPDRFSEDGIREFWRTVQVAKDVANPELRVLGILLTNHNPRTNLGQVYLESYEELAEMMESKVFNTYIRRNIKLAEAASTGESICSEEYARTAPKLLEDYNNLIDELIKTTEEGADR